MALIFLLEGREDAEAVDGQVVSRMHESRRWMLLVDNDPFMPENSCQCSAGRGRRRLRVLVFEKHG